MRYTFTTGKERLSTRRGRNTWAWRAQPGHPVHDFLVSGATALVEDIREDTESGSCLSTDISVAKRAASSSWASGPIGWALLESFEVGYLLDELSNLELVDQVSFVDAGFTIRASDNPELVGAAVEDPAVLAALVLGRGMLR